MEKKYPKEIEQIKEDIKELKIQGATNVAISSMEGMKLFLKSSWGSKSTSDLINSCIDAGRYLADTRENEPLARNGVIFVEKNSRNILEKNLPIEESQDEMEKYIDEYLNMISSSKRDILEKNTENLLQHENVLTHCHSSTAVDLLKKIAKEKGRENFGVVCTETRPNFQGRITAKALVEARVDTTLIADSAAESYAIGRGSRPVDAVFLGCDQFTKDGYMINKIGSWGIAMSAHYADIPVYVVTPLLKIDPKISAFEIEIEVREDKELWSDAPKGLDMFNPSFEIVDKSLITAYLTDEGFLKPSELENITRGKYPWLFDN